MKKEKKCKYCGTFDNLYKYKTIVLNCCEEHYIQYKIDKDTKRSETNLKRYGFKCQFVGMRNEIKQTNIEKYGTENPFGSVKIQEKIKQTNIERYGVDNASKDNLVKNKYKETCMTKYGVDNVFKLNDIKQKSTQTLFSKYGVLHPMYSEKIKEKIRQTNIKRYGVENPTQNKVIFKRACKNTIMNYKDTELTYQCKEELYFIEYCIKNNIKIENGDRIPYKFDNKQHYYFVDFKIKEKNSWRLVEIKSKHPWYYDELISGKLKSKVIFAQAYSIIHNYLPFKIIFNNNYEFINYNTCN